MEKTVTIELTQTELEAIGDSIALGEAVVTRNADAAATSADLLQATVTKAGPSIFERVMTKVIPGIAELDPAAYAGMLPAVDEAKQRLAL